MTVNHGVLGSSPCSGALLARVGSLAQLVQSVCLTSRGSGVRIPQLPPNESSRLQQCKRLFHEREHSSVGLDAPARQAGGQRFKSACSHDPENTAYSNVSGVFGSDHNVFHRSQPKRQPNRPAKSRTSSAHHDACGILSSPTRPATTDEVFRKTVARNGKRRKRLSKMRRRLAGEINLSYLCTRNRGA